MRNYCHPGRVVCVWLDVAQSRQVRHILYPALVGLWDQCGVLISRQQANLRRALAAFKKKAEILESLMDTSDAGYPGGRVLPLAAEHNTPFMTCERLTEALKINGHAEWPVLVSQLSDAGDIVILQRARDGRLGLCSKKKEEENKKRRKEKRKRKKTEEKEKEKETCLHHFPFLYCY